MAQQVLASRRSTSGGHRERRVPSRVAAQPEPAHSESAFDGLELVALPDLGRSAVGARGATSILQLQRHHGNRFVQRLIAGQPRVQRCGGTVHAGCACAANGGQAQDEEEPAAPSAVPTVAPLRLQRLTEVEKAEDLKSARYAGVPRLESAFDNTPPMKSGEKGEAVKSVQQGLLDDGFEMPVSTKKTGEPDGIYGGETVKVVRDFQKKHDLTDNGFADGVVGRRTMGKLDELAGSGPPKKEIGPQKQDLEITGKSRFAADRDGSIFFEKDSAAFFDEDERKKVDGFVTPKDGDLTLHGVVSEDEDPSLATQRIATVSAELTKGKHEPAHVTPNPDAAAGKGDLDYRSARRVEIVTAGAKPAGPKCEDDQGNKLPDKDPCDAAMEAKLAAAKIQSDALIDGAVAALAKAPLDAATLTALDVTFGGNVAGAGKKHASTVKLQLGRIKNQIAQVVKPKGHNCANLCDSGCSSSGGGAYNFGVGAAAVMTLCQDYRDYTGNQPAIYLIHESAHGTPGLETDDFAYSFERGIDFLKSSQSLRNSDSYVNFVFRISTGDVAEKPPEDMLVGMDGNAGDQDAARRSLARVEKLVQFGSQDIGSLYDTVKKAQKHGSWFHPKVEGFGPVLMTLTAPRFALTPVVKPPTNRDRFAVAAISDRYQQMIFSLRGTPHTVTKDLKTATAWEAGPGPNISLGPEFFAADAQTRVDILFAALVKATPGISGGMVAEYIALAKDIEKTFHS